MPITKCPHCERELGETTAVSCPECGEPLVASGPADPDQTAEWVADTMVLPHASASSSPATPTPTADLTTDLVGSELDIYSIEGYLGRGGMAWVFLAQHNGLQRPCAIKILRPELHNQTRDSVEMFVAEARAAASVVHPHIVTVHNIGSSPLHHFIELEYVAGQSLDDLMDSEDVSSLQAIDLMCQSTSALAQAHRVNLIHRDFKPANIMVSVEGVAKLADFGLAKQLGASKRGFELAGTPYFMAPEIFQGEAASKSSDVYAVGVSLHRMLAGSYPFDAPQWTDLAKMHVEQAAPDLRQADESLPDDLAELVADCLRKDGAQRPRDGSELYDRLTAVFRSMRDLRALAADAFTGLDLDWTVEPTGIVARVRLANGRMQTVRVEEAHGDLWSTPLVRIFSVCAPIEESYMRRALEMNSQMPHGALAVQDIDGAPHFVVINSYPRSTCDAEELRHSVSDIAAWADEVEQFLTGEDQQ
ncbi:MAG: protein kinase [Pirellulaceae bacterium]|jgi:serine/threonine-protein kinase|nr:protein kinase [Pirellulaceae bacterium]MDP7015923.1 protein kinase [Pirellulaceae bacterium]